MNANIRTSGSFSKTGCIPVLLLAIIFGCGKDDPGPAFLISTQPAEVSFIAVNTCHAGGGVYYTRFNFRIPYETSTPDIEIEKIDYSITTGSTVIEKEDYTFDDDGKEITFSLCIRFAGAPGVDYTSTLVATNGLKSKASKVTINRPAGAN